MTDRLLQRLAETDPATTDRISRVARSLLHVPTQIATSPEGADLGVCSGVAARSGARSRSPLRPSSSSGCPPGPPADPDHQSQPGAGSLLDDGWYQVGTLEDLRAQGPALYLPDYGIFVW